MSLRSVIETSKSLIVFYDINKSLLVALCHDCRCSCHPGHHSQLRWLITDFSFSNKNLDSDAFVVTNQGRGTPAYRAPELIRPDGREFCRRSDSWSIGCILFKVATTNNRSAFRNDFDVAQYSLSPKIGCPKLEANDNIKLQLETECPIQGHRIPLWQQINAILELCFTREPEQRATAFQLKEIFEKIWRVLPENCA